MQRIMIHTTMLSLCLLLILAGCSSSKSEAVTAIETYINALGNKDVNLISSVSCANWEQDALIEVDSLTAVGSKVQDLSCEVAGEDGDTTYVSCTGTIALDYGGEAQQIDLSNRTYIARQEAGDWRMCGYK